MKHTASRVFAAIVLLLVLTLTLWVVFATNAAHAQVTKITTGSSATPTLINKQAYGDLTHKFFYVGNGSTAINCGFFYPLTTNADILIQAGGIPSRLAIGSAGQFLRVSGGVPTWMTTVIDDLNDVTITTPANGDVLTYSGGVWINQAGSASAFSGTPGSVIFLNGAGHLAEDNAKFYWDDSAFFLGLGTNSPNTLLTAAGGLISGGTYWSLGAAYQCTIDLAAYNTDHPGIKFDLAGTVPSLRTYTHSFVTDVIFSANNSGDTSFVGGGDNLYIDAHTASGSVFLAINGLDKFQVRPNYVELKQASGAPLDFRMQDGSGSKVTGFVAPTALTPATLIYTLPTSNPTNGYVLTAGTPSGGYVPLSWTVAGGSGMVNPLTTTGDIIYSSSGSTAARLGVGSTGEVLTVAGGVPTWAAGGGLPSASLDQTLCYNGSNWIANSTFRVDNANGEAHIGGYSVGTGYFTVVGGSTTEPGIVVTMGTATPTQAYQTWRYDNGGAAVVKASVTKNAEGNFSALYQTGVNPRTSNYTATLDDSVLPCNATGGAFTITLPTAVGITGRMFTVKKTDAVANTVTVGTTSSQTIDGSTTYTGLAAQWQTITVVSDGANWFIISKF